MIVNPNCWSRNQISREERDVEGRTHFQFKWPWNSAVKEKMSHDFNNSPQFAIQGQWWSCLATHRLQNLQCLDLRGLLACSRRKKKRCREGSKERTKMRKRRRRILSAALLWNFVLPTILAFSFTFSREQPSFLSPRLTLQISLTKRALLSTHQTIHTEVLTIQFSLFSQSMNCFFSSYFICWKWRITRFDSCSSH